MQIKWCHSSLTMHLFFLFSAPSKWNVFFRITEIGAHKLRLHAPFTIDIIKGRLLSDAFSDVFMSCICFADTVNICGNKHIFIVICHFIVIVIVIVSVIVIVINRAYGLQHKTDTECQ